MYSWFVNIIHSSLSKSIFDRLDRHHTQHPKLTIALSIVGWHYLVDDLQLVINQMLCGGYVFVCVCVCIQNMERK